MRVLLLLAALTVPALAQAACGIVRAEGVVSIVVGAKGGNCFSSRGFRESFLADLNRGLAAEKPASEARSRPAARSRPPVAAVPAQPGGSYYGQR